MGTQIIEQVSTTIVETGTESSLVVQNDVVATLIDTTIGATGATGAAGVAAEFIHIQSIPSALWTIDHTLDSAFPNPTVKDSTDDQVFGAVTYVTASQMTISFSGAFSGTARLI